MERGKESNHDYSMERRLRTLSPALHGRFTGAVFAMQHYLSRYRLLFPQFSDHSELHSMTVIDFCNQLIGDKIKRLNEDELYVLLMGCYLHDTGMGITLDQYREFIGKIDPGDYFDTHRRDDYPAIIRNFHHEFSGLFIRKYAALFDIPSEAHLQAIVQVARGHRKTDLMDEDAYPLAFPVPGGNTVCLPYLTALIRLADEIDVTAARNPALLFDIESLTDEEEIVINRMIQAVRRLEVSESAFTLYVDPSDQRILERVRQMTFKMQKTLDTCRAAVLGRTPYAITQEQIHMRETAGF